MQSKNEINLLPVEAKQKRQQLVYAYRWNYLYTSMVIGLVIIIGAYASAYGMFLWIKDGIQRSLIQEVQSQDTTIDEIQTINQTLQPLRQKVEKSSFWASRIDDITGAMSGNDIVSFEYNQTAKTLIIKGTAVSRNNVVSIEERLRILDWVDSVDAPLQNFAQQSQVEFSFTIHLL